MIFREEMAEIRKLKIFDYLHDRLKQRVKL